MTMCVPPKPPFVGNDTVALTLSFAESFSATSSFDPSHRRRAYIIQDAGRTTPRSPRAACNHGASQAARSLIKVPQPAARVLAQARVQGSHTTFRFRASCGPQQRERSCCPLHAVSDRRCCPLHAVSYRRRVTYLHLHCLLGYGRSSWPASPQRAAGRFTRHTSTSPSCATL